MALPEVKQSVTEARLSALTMPDAGCTRAAREDALARVLEIGLPGRRDEYWKYTQPDTLVAPDAIPAAVFADDEPLVFQWNLIGSTSSSWMVYSAPKSRTICRWKV